VYGGQCEAVTGFGKGFVEIERHGMTAGRTPCKSDGKAAFRGTLAVRK